VKFLTNAIARGALGERKRLMGPLRAESVAEMAEYWFPANWLGMGAPIAWQG